MTAGCQLDRHAGRARRLDLGRGLPAKPVVDVAAHLAWGVNETGVITALGTRRYVFRGDRKDHGGLLFIDEDQHHRRIVHLHVLRHNDPQWERYVRLRELLRRRSPGLRRVEA